MARKRMIDPEFWSDEQVGKWSFQARLFYIGLWNFADDEGKFKAHNDLLKSQIFPYEKKIDINKLKNELGNKILWYKVENSAYGQIKNFLKYQTINRPTPSKLPNPKDGVIDDSLNPHGTLTPNRIEVNLREEKGSERRKVAPLSDDEFVSSLETNPAYRHIDVQVELAKMDAWLSTRPRRQKTRRFIVNWLNKIEKPFKEEPKRTKFNEGLKEYRSPYKED